MARGPIPDKPLDAFLARIRFQPTPAQRRVLERVRRRQRPSYAAMINVANEEGAGSSYRS